MAQMPKPRPIGTVPEDRPILREVGGDLIVFQYSTNGHPFLLCPVFWQGPDTNAWHASSDGRLPGGTARFPSRTQAEEAMFRS